ncbi:MAG: hypothetical protein ACI9W4_001826 [Rhodothermales bacterium]|jgi:hypothetical protein
MLLILSVLIAVITTHSDEEVGGQLGPAREIAERKLGGYLRVEDNAHEEDGRFWSTASLGLPVMSPLAALPPAEPRSDVTSYAGPSKR